VWEWNNRHALQGRALSTEAGRKENTEESMLKLPLHFFHDHFRRLLEWATIPLNPFLCLRAVIWCVLKTALEPSSHIIHGIVFKAIGPNSQSHMIVLARSEQE
jgi:hypothetical protein